VRALITGATGLLARHLVPRLAAQCAGPHRALVLPGEDATALRAFDIDVVRGDIRDPDAVHTAVKGIDVVFHLAGMMGVWRPYSDYLAVNVDGAVNVCRAAQAADVERVVHVSSWTVYGMARGGWIDEDAPLAPFGEPYARSKTAGDLAIQRLIAQENVRAVIVRPGTFFGPGDRLHFGRIADRLRAGRGLIVGSGTNALPFVYVDDIVQGLLLAAFRDRAIGRAYNITTDEPLTQGEFLAAIAEELRLPPPSAHAPYAALYAAGCIAEALAALTRSRKQPILTRLGVRVFGDDNRHAIARARAELGYAPRVTVREGIARAAAWYRGDEKTSAGAPGEAAA
jgi:nucleoside-diphosphate-sugar epimerase